METGKNETGKEGKKQREKNYEWKIGMIEENKEKQQQKDEEICEN